MNDNPYAAGSFGGIDLTFGGALNNLPEGVDKGKAFEMLMNDALANKRSKENTTELRELLEYAGSPERQKQILDMTLGFQNEQMKEAGKYKALFNLPSIIAQAAYTPAAIRARGTEQAANIISQNIGNMKMGPINSQVPLYGSVNYFG